MNFLLSIALGALTALGATLIHPSIPPLGVIARNPDFVALAQACGASGLKVRSAAELIAAIGAALRRPGPTLIEVLETEFVVASATDALSG